MNAELARKRREFFEPNLPPTNSFNLIDLPTEVLEEVFYFLPAKTICKDVHQTCKRLCNISRTPVFWSSYLKRAKSFEPVSNRIVDTEPWKRAFSFEQEEKRWQENQSLYRYRSVQAHSATVDSLIVHETPNGNRLAVSGSRDRSICLWNLKNVAENETEKSTWYKTQFAAHSAWIWTICIGEDGKNVFSGGLDSMIKQWEVVDGGLVLLRERSNNNEALLNCLIENNTLYTATYTSKIMVADIRISLDPQQTFELPRRNAVNCMKSLSTSNYIYTMSTQTGNLFSIDKRQMKICQRSRNFLHCSSLDLNDESLVASWKDGTVKYLNPMNLKTEYTWVCKAQVDLKNLSPVRLSKGAFVYANSYELLVYTPGRRPQLLGRLPTKDMIISLDYKNGDLACGMSEGVVMFWPRENQKFSLVDHGNT
ncbi:F-box/WD repeat-containing protein 9 [Aphelenchoides bicaudatus]|nr:F-box/WD repeat-containing protein 9 [Aphelenchoides bicaudatus]